MIAAAGGDLELSNAIEIVASRLRNPASEPPVDLAAVGTLLGVSGWRSEDLPVAGELRREGPNFIIAHATGMPVGRRRFTIAHELCHAFFESTGAGCPRIGEELELICDKFAASLLLPAQTLREDLAEWSPGHAIELAKRYEVSLSALLLRAEEVADRHGALLDADGRVILATAMIGGQRDARREDLARLSAHALAGLNVTAALPRNRRWNGPWRLESQPIAGNQRFLVTGTPVDAEGTLIPRKVSMGTGTQTQTQISPFPSPDTARLPSLSD